MTEGDTAGSMVGEDTTAELLGLNAATEDVREASEEERCRESTII